MTSHYEEGYTQGFADALEGRMEAVNNNRLQGEARRAEIRGILNQAFSKGAGKGFALGRGEGHGEGFAQGRGKGYAHGLATGERRGFRKGYSKGKFLVWTRAVPKAKGQGKGL